jgi:hypothetical protein
MQGLPNVKKYGILNTRLDAGVTKDGLVMRMSDGTGVRSISSMPNLEIQDCSSHN